MTRSVAQETRALIEFQALPTDFLSIILKQVHARGLFGMEDTVTLCMRYSTARNGNPNITCQAKSNRRLEIPIVHAL